MFKCDVILEGSLVSGVQAGQQRQLKPENKKPKD